MSARRRARPIEHDLSDVWSTMNDLRNKFAETDRILARVVTELEHNNRTVRDMAAKLETVSGQLNTALVELNTVKATRSHSFGDTVKEWAGVWVSVASLGAMLLMGIAFYVKNDRPQPAPFAYEHSVPNTPRATKRSRE